MESPIVTMDLVKTCRACLKTVKSHILHSLFEEPLKSMFYESTFVKVKPADEYPYNLCSLCVALCDAAYNFREMCEENDRKIRMTNITFVTSSPNSPLIVKKPPVTVTISTSPPLSNQLGNEPQVQMSLPPEEITETIEDDNIEETVEEAEDIHQSEEEVEEVPPKDEVMYLHGYGQLNPHVEIMEERMDEESIETQEEEPQDSEEIKEQVSDGVAPDEATNCQFCSEKFHGKINLLEHYSQEHQDETYNCTNCRELFNSLNHWRSHCCRRPKKEKRNYVCDYCSLTSSHRRKFANHLLAEHPGAEYRCDRCKKSYYNAETWRTHMCKEDAWEYVCNFCEACFGFKAQLSRHMKRHKEGAKKSYENKKVPCNMCTATFHSQFYLKQHQLLHTGDTPHACKFCKRPFRSKCNLLRHIRGVHKDNETKFSDL